MCFRDRPRVFGALGVTLEFLERRILPFRGFRVFLLRDVECATIVIFVAHDLGCP